MARRAHVSSRRRPARRRCRCPPPVRYAYAAHTVRRRYVPPANGLRCRSGGGGGGMLRNAISTAEIITATATTSFAHCPSPGRYRFDFLTSHPGGAYPIGPAEVKVCPYEFCFFSPPPPPTPALPPSSPLVVNATPECVCVCWRVPFSRSQQKPLLFFKRFGR